MAPTWRDECGSGTVEINELIGADSMVRKGRNAMRLGIAAVSARLENGTLRVVEGACPNLLREAGLYRYATEADSRRGESPLDHDDHAMDALRYLIATIDERKLGRRRWFGGGAAREPEKKEQKWLSLYNEALWTPVWRAGAGSLVAGGRAESAQPSSRLCANPTHAALPVSADCSWFIGPDKVYHPLLAHTLGYIVNR